MYFIRREVALKRRIARRLRSSRASVYLEYAIVLPLAVLMISTLIEFASLWDAKIMANHTAWTCARIATVEAGARTEYVESPQANRLRTAGMQKAVTLLMATCSMGSMHGSAQTYAKNWFETDIILPLKDLRSQLVRQFTAKLTDFIADSIRSAIGFDLMSKAVSKVITEFSKWIVDTFFKDLINTLAGKLTDLFKPMLENLSEFLQGDRKLRQLGYAASRMKDYPDIVTVSESYVADLIFGSKRTALSSANSRLDFPRCIDSSATSDGWFVTSDSSWPPNNQKQRMITVKIAWPFERAWLFPVLSQAKLPEKEAKSLEGVPTAVGQALFYPQPIIRNDNLRSSGATAYDPGGSDKMQDIAEMIRRKLNGIIQLAALSLRYQLGTEQVGPYKSGGDYSSTTYKGVGLGVAGDFEKSKLFKEDGLVFWMNRAPDHPDDQRTWPRKSSPPDYKRCWKELVETDDERVAFFRDGIFIHHPTPELHKLCFQVYHAKEWFFWGDGENRHLRLKHVNPKHYQLAFDGRFLKKEKKNGGKKSIPDIEEIIGVRKPYKEAFLCSSDWVDWPISPKEYEKAVEGVSAVVSYWEYANFCKRNKQDFGSNVRAMIGTWRSDRLSSCDVAERSVASDFTGERFVRIENEIHALLKDCLTELEKASGSGDKSDDEPEDIEGFFSLDGMDEEIMKDPKKAEEFVDKKVKEVTDKVCAALREVDRCEQALRDIDKTMLDDLDALADRRRKDLLRFAVATGQAIWDAGLKRDVALVRNALLANHPWVGDGPEAVTRELLAIRDRYNEALVNLYNAELALANALGCKSAKKRPPLVPNAPDLPLKPVDPAPNRPRPSSGESGTDNDWGGDSWTLDKDGWKQDNGKDDI